MAGNEIAVGGALQTPGAASDRGPSQLRCAVAQLLLVVLLGTTVQVVLITTTARPAQASDVGSAVVAAARGQAGYAANPSGTYCNKFSAYWGSGRNDCGNGNRDVAWCADFVAWAWAQAGITGLYGNGINANASSFRTWGQANGRWHPLGDGYVPQPGDAAEYSDAHVGIYTGGPANSPTVISGDWYYPDRNNGQVYEQANVTSTISGGGAALSGYVAAPDRSGGIPPPAIGNGGSRLVNANSSRCIDAIGAGTTNGTAIQLWDCNDSAAQQWIYQGLALHIYGNYDKCLDADAGGLTANGTRIQVWDCNGGDNQKFTADSEGRLVSVASGRCLDAVGAGTANGTLLQLYDCNDTGAQVWVGAPTPNGGAPVVATGAGRCLDVPGGGISPGLQTDIYDCNASAAQQWRVMGSSLMVYQDKCLDVAGAGTVNGTAVQIWYCNGSAAQSWTWHTNGTVTSDASGKCLDVRGGATADGTPLQIWDCNGSAAQTFLGPGSPASTSPPPTGSSVLPTPTVNAPDKSPPISEMGALKRRTAKSKVRLTWSASDVGSGVATYTVRVRTRQHHRWARFSTIRSLRATVATTARVSGLRTGTTYCFSVQATDRAGNVSPWSNAACVRRLDSRHSST